MYHCVGEMLLSAEMQGQHMGLIVRADLRNSCQSPTGALEGPTSTGRDEYRPVVVWCEIRSTRRRAVRLTSVSSWKLHATQQRSVRVTRQFRWAAVMAFPASLTVLNELIF